MNPSSVSVIVVSYNTSAQLRRCLSQIEQVHELIVVDNNSSDDSVAMVSSNFPHAIVKTNPENLGFGRANNVGASMATRPYLLFLNSDAYAEPGAIDRLAEYLSDPGVAAVGGRLNNLDGSLQSSTANQLTLWAVFCEQFYLEKVAPRSKWLSPYWSTLRLVREDEPAETEQVMGACLMIRKGSELFDDRYFLYCEDTDLCLRLRRRGKILYIKGAVFYHELGSSSGKSPVRGVYRYNRGKELYFSIHHGPLSALTCKILDRAGALLRSCFWGLKSLGMNQDAGRKFRAFLQISLGKEPIGT